MAAMACYGAAAALLGIALDEATARDPWLAALIVMAAGACAYLGRVSRAGRA